MSVNQQHSFLGFIQPDPSPEIKLPARSASRKSRLSSGIMRKPFVRGPGRPNSWRHPGGTVSETEEGEFSESETDKELTPKTEGPHWKDRPTDSNKGANASSAEDKSPASSATSSNLKLKGRVVLFPSGKKPKYTSSFSFASFSRFRGQSGKGGTTQTAEDPHLGSDSSSNYDSHSPLRGGVDHPTGGGECSSKLLSTPNAGTGGQMMLANRASPNRKLKEATDKVSGKLRAYAHKLKKDQDQQQTSSLGARSGSVGGSAHGLKASARRATHKRSISLVTSETQGSSAPHSIAEEPAHELAANPNPGDIAQKTLGSVEVIDHGRRSSSQQSTPVIGSSPKSAFVRVVPSGRRVTPLQRSLSGDTCIPPKRMDEIRLHKIQEKNVIGSYANGLIPIRSASFSSSEPYKRRIHWQDKTVKEEESGQALATSSEVDPGSDSTKATNPPMIAEESEGLECTPGVKKNSPEITIELCSEVTPSTKLELDDPSNPDTPEGKSTVAHEPKVGRITRKKSDMMNHFILNSHKLSRSASWKSSSQSPSRVSNSSAGKGKCDRLPPSLQHLHLEATCPSSIKVSFKLFGRACPTNSDAAATSSREDTLSPAVSGKSFGESTETLINIDEAVAFGPKIGYNGTNHASAGVMIPAHREQHASTTFQDDTSTNRALEISEQTPYADALLDQLTQKGYMDKEIKVAEVVEVDHEVDAWDDGEESLYGAYDIMGVLENVDIEEMSSYDPELQLIQPINAAELIQEGQSTLHMPTLQQPQLYYSGEYPIGFLVQDFGPKPGGGRTNQVGHRHSSQNAFQDNNGGDSDCTLPDLASYEGLNQALGYNHSHILGDRLSQDHEPGLHQHRASIMEINDDGLSMAVSNQAEELLPLQHHYHQIVPAEDGHKAVDLIKRANLFPSTSMSSDELDFFGMAQNHPQVGSSPSQWNLEPFGEDGSAMGYAQKAPKEWSNNPNQGSQAQASGFSGGNDNAHQHIRFNRGRPVERSPQLVDIDWDLLGEQDDNKDRTEYLVQSNSQPRRDNQAPVNFRGYTSVYNDSDGISSEASYPRAKGGPQGNPEYAYLNFESDIERYHDFSGDEDDVPHSRFESHGTIQEAIKRQQRHEEEQKGSVVGQPGIKSPFVVDASNAPGEQGPNAMGMPIMSSMGNTSRAQQPPVAYMAQMRVGPLRGNASMPVMDGSQRVFAVNQGRHLVKLPRGRHPLRGPFGQMLDAQMSKSELTKKNLLQGASDTLSFIQQLSDKGSSPAASESDVPIDYHHPSARQVKSDSLTHWIASNCDLSKNPYGGDSSSSLAWNDLNAGQWPQDAVAHRQPLQSRPATMIETSAHQILASHPQQLPMGPGGGVGSLDGPASDTKINHIRTRSSPCKLIGDLDLEVASTPTSPTKKRSECNFADINQEELTVHQDLLVSRNPRLEDTKATSQDNGMKSGSFRRRGDTRTLIVKELHNVEKSYVESLQFLVVKYYRPLKNHDRHQIISSVLADDIFFQIPEILYHHESFLNSLKHRLEHWDPKQTIGDWFLECFSKKPVIDTYTAFIRNVKRADEAIRIARQTKPAFDRFLQDMRRERRGERLSLADLLAKPHQRIPRYRLLIQRLLEHTETDHADFSLLRRAEREIHELALKISSIQKETNEQENRQKVLRQLELSIQGLNANDLGSPTRSLIQYDMVTMTNGPWSTKDRCLFLFNDLLIITSISKRAARDVRRGASSIHNLSQLLDNSRQKLWMYVSVEEVEISKAKEEYLKKIMRENRDIEEDINTLRMIGDATSRLHCPHKELDDLTRQLMGQLNRQLAERQNADTQQAMYLDLNVTTSDGIETISLIFADAERRSQWEDTFNEIKQNLVRHDDKKAPPDFLNLIPIRKTRSGLQFTCAAPTLGLNAHKLKDVWVCNSDGYVGQVCVLSLLPEPTVICCNGVCNARILSIVSVPSIPRSCDTSASSIPALQQITQNTGETSSIGSYEKPSPPVADLVDSSPNVSNQSQLDSSSASEFELRRHLREVVLESSSSSDEDEEIDEGTVPKKKSQSVPIAKETPSPASSPIAMKTSASPTPDIATSASKISSTMASILTMSDSPTASNVGVPPPDDEQSQTESQTQGDPDPSTLREEEECQATMWLGTEDGHIHVYNCSDNIRIKKNKEKFFHTAPVLGILYLDDRVYAALGNGHILVYSRGPNGVWDKGGAKTLPVGTPEHPVTKMITIGKKIWCAAHNVIKVIDSTVLELETSFTIDDYDGENSPSILAIVHSGWAVWLTMEQSAVVKAYHIQSLECICQVKVTSVVNKVLAGCDEIIRQHKAACLRITALLTCKDILWIGTSAGVIVTMRLPHLSCNYAKIAQLAPLIGNPHGHSGHVRFLTSVEMTPEVQRTPFGKNLSRFSRTSKGDGSANNAPSGQHKMLVISGGDGYENFANNSNSEMIGREDSTNHLLLWQI